jgi:hypothetical protein
MTADGDAFGYAQEQFTKEYTKVEADAKTISRESNRRRFVAYIFKLLAVFGGLAVAAGVSGQAAQIIRIAIAPAVSLDFVFSNHERLIVVVEARNAYRRLLNQVRREHQQKLTPIIDLKHDDPGAAKKQGIALLQELLVKLHSGCEKVEEALSEADLKALRAISMEEHRARR